MPRADRTYDPEEAMKEEPMPGKNVRWNNHGGTAHGKVVRKLTRPITIKGHKVAASPENPH